MGGGREHPAAELERAKRAWDPRGMKTGKLNMAGSEVDDLASLEPKIVNEGAVVELIRRRYSQNKIYVSKVLAARAPVFLTNYC